MPGEDASVAVLKVFSEVARHEILASIVRVSLPVLTLGMHVGMTAVLEVGNCTRVNIVHAMVAAVGSRAMAGAVDIVLGA